MKIRMTNEDIKNVQDYLGKENTTGINKKLNGVDLLIWFQNKHLYLEDLPEGLALRQSDEIAEKIPNIVEIVTDFLYKANALEYYIEEVADNESESTVSS